MIYSAGKCGKFGKNSSISQVAILRNKRIKRSQPTKRPRERRISLSFHINKYLSIIDSPPSLVVETSSGMPAGGTHTPNNGREVSDDTRGHCWGAPRCRPAPRSVDRRYHRDDAMHQPILFKHRMRRSHRTIFLTRRLDFCHLRLPLCAISGTWETPCAAESAARRTTRGLTSNQGGREVRGGSFCILVPHQYHTPRWRFAGFL